MLHAPITHTDAWIQRINHMRLSLLKTAGPRAFVRATPLFLYPNWWANETGDKLAKREERSVATVPSPSIVEGRTNAIANYRPFNDLHRISLPTRLICAEDDFLTPPYFTQRIAGEIKHAEVQWMARGRHACSQTVPDEFNKVVLDYLTGIEKKNGAAA